MPRKDTRDRAEYQKLYLASLSPEKREEKKRQQRAWYARNREKLLERSKKHREKNKAKRQAYYQKNKLRIREQQKIYYNRYLRAEKNDSNTDQSSNW